MVLTLFSTSPRHQEGLQAGDHARGQLPLLERTLLICTYHSRSIIKENSRTRRRLRCYPPSSSPSHAAKPDIRRGCFVGQPWGRGKVFLASISCLYFHFGCWFSFYGRKCWEEKYLGKEEGEREKGDSYFRFGYHQHHHHLIIAVEYIPTPTDEFFLLLLAAGSAAAAANIYTYVFFSSHIPP